MAEVQANDVVSHGYRGPDRRRHNFLGRVQRLIISCMRSRWIAMFVIAFAVSLAFHEYDQKSIHRVERQHQLMVCVVKGVAAEQHLHPYQHVNVTLILQGCEKLHGKE